VPDLGGTADNFDDDPEQHHTGTGKLGQGGTYGTGRQKMARRHMPQKRQPPFNVWSSSKRLWRPRGPRPPTPRVVPFKFNADAPAPDPADESQHEVRPLPPVSKARPVPRPPIRAPQQLEFLKEELKDEHFD
jgi:hypothetical protein